MYYNTLTRFTFIRIFFFKSLPTLNTYVILCHVYLGQDFVMVMSSFAKSQFNTSHTLDFPFFTTSVSA